MFRALEFRVQSRGLKTEPTERGPSSYELH